MNKARFAALAALAIISGPVQAASDCPKLPKTVPLKVDSMHTVVPFVYVTVSGVPPGWYVKCAVRDKDGNYLGAEMKALDGGVRILGPAFTMMMIGAARPEDAVGADCIAINPAKEEE